MKLNKNQFENYVSKITSILIEDKKIQLEKFKDKLGKLNKDEMSKALINMTNAKTKTDKEYLNNLVSNNTNDVIIDKIIRLSLASEKFINSFLKESLNLNKKKLIKEHKIPDLIFNDIQQRITKGKLYLDAYKQNDDVKNIDKCIYWLETVIKDVMDQKKKHERKLQSIQQEQTAGKTNYVKFLDDINGVTGISKKVKGTSKGITGKTDYVKFLDDINGVTEIKEKISKLAILLNKKYKKVRNEEFRFVFETTNKYGKDFTKISNDGKWASIWIEWKEDGIFVEIGKITMLKGEIYRVKRFHYPPNQNWDVLFSQMKKDGYSVW